MIVTADIQDLRSQLELARSAGRTVGVCPTMGALHGGHRSNIRKAAAECDFVAVTVYVNELQFGAGEDLESYPRDLEGDCAQAEQAGADMVVAPPPARMWVDPPLARVHVARLGDLFEGRQRPGHFDGVATVVTKLLALAGPCRAYFGEKDYQQLVVVRRLVSDLSLPASVVACPTVRDPDGLALSSRNAYLTPEQRAAAPVLYWSLLAGKRAIEEEGVTRTKEVRAAMTAAAGRQAAFELEYAEVVDPEDLTVPVTVEAEVRLLIAGRIGATRLIDNVPASAGEV